MNTYLEGANLITLTKYNEIKYASKTQNRRGGKTERCPRQRHKAITRGKWRQERLLTKTELHSAGEAERVPHPLLLARVFLSPLSGV